MANEYLTIFFGSMLPIAELRGSIPIGILFYNLDWFFVSIVSILGNFLVCIPILYLLSYCEDVFNSYTYPKKILAAVYRRTRSRSRIINQYKYLGIILLVGIPAPFTGAWTGCLASHIFGFDKKKTIIAVLLGLIISATLVNLIIFFAEHLLHLIGYKAIN